MQNEDLNITPDMLKNLSSMLGMAKSSDFSASATKNNEPNNLNHSTIKSNESNNLNHSTIKSNESNNLNHSTIKSKNINNSNISTNIEDIKEEKEKSDMNIDFETILKIKSVVEKLNKKDDPRTNLLYSLKPYLNKNRQQKLDTYANILKISDVASLFKEQKKGDEN